MSPSGIDSVLDRLAKALAERDEARRKLHVIRGTVDGYLNHGLGGGARGVCMRIKQVLEEKNE